VSAALAIAPVVAASRGAVSLMRDAVLLGAECLAALPVDEVPNAEQPLVAHPERRAALAERIRRLDAAPDTLLAQLADELDLDRASQWLTALCLAVEIHPEAAAAVSILGEDQRVQLVKPVVFARLATMFLGIGFIEALALSVGGGDAQRAGLIEVLEPVPGLPHTHQALRCAATAIRVLLLGEAPVPARAGAVVVQATGYAFDERTVAGAARVLRAHGVLLLRSASRRAARQFACDLATEFGMPAEFIPAGEDAPARSHGGALLVLDWHSAPAEKRLDIPASPGRPVVAIVPERTDGATWPIFDVGRLGHCEALRAWRTMLPAEDAAVLAAAFRVGTADIAAAIREAEVRREIDGNDAAPDAAAIVSRLRAQGARRMGRHVSVIEPRCGLSHLVVPPAVSGKLDELVAAHRVAERVFGSMGVVAHTSFGRGINCLFSGKPGTGKTFAAQCVAFELGLNVYRIDLAQVVSKYIGETEKALSEVFDEAEAGHGILLFDEADALFGKRSEVKDAHDRYANIEVGYLLQRMEAFDGLAMLTTNLPGNLDAAFTRRLRFVIDFPIPDHALRRQLWERALPGPDWRADDLDLDTFARRFALSGGNIQNIGVAAAHLAAASPSSRVTNGQLVHATVRELEKTGRPCSADAFGPLAPLLAGIPA
jgi:ATPase family associated with various cellular activities (AAA)